MRSNKTVNTYINQIGSLLQLPAAEKRAFLASFRAQLDSADLPPDAALEELYARFGAPEEIAGSMLGESAPKYLKKRTSLRRIAVIAAAAILTLALFCVVFELIDNHRQSSGYGKEYAVEYATADSPEGEIGG